MINALIEPHREKIEKVIGDEEFRYLIDSLRKGYDQFMKVKPLVEGIGDMKTHQPVVGHVRSKKIDDFFSNNIENAAKIGFQVDTFRAGSMNLPKLTKDNVILTIKQCKKIKNITSDPSEYMKELVEKNRAWNPQVSMFDEECTYVEATEKHMEYYGIVTYYFNEEHVLKDVNIVFFDEKFENVLLELSATEDMLKSTDTKSKKQVESKKDTENKEQDESLKEFMDFHKDEKKVGKN